MLQLYGGMKNVAEVDPKSASLKQWEGVDRKRVLPYGALVRLGMKKPLKKKKLIGREGRIFAVHKPGKSYKLQLKKKKTKKTKQDFSVVDKTSFTIVPIGSLEWNGHVQEHGTGIFDWRQNDPAKDQDLYESADQWYVALAKT